MTGDDNAGLRILHIGSGRYRRGDRSHATYRIWHELAAGFKSYSVVARSAGPPAFWRDGNLDIRLVASKFARDSEFLFTQFGAVRSGVRLSPHAIVCQSPVMGGLAALRIAARTGARLLVEIHSDIYVSPARPGTPQWLLQRLSRLALNRAAFIRVLSATMRERLLDRYGPHLADRVRVLPPRVDLACFPARTRERRAGGPLQLIMVGSITSRKGQLRLIEALRGAPFAIDLHLVGDGPDRPACERRARESPPRLSVVCHGPLDPAAVSERLGAADVLVMYSSSEGTPRAMMEAMAVGLPVVTTNAGFCADVVEHGVEGFVLGPDPDREILPVLARLHDDPDLAARLGAAARRRAVRDYDSVQLFDRYRALIAETAAR